MLVNLIVKDQELRWYGRPVDFAVGFVDQIILQFTKSDDWLGYTLTAQFSQNLNGDVKTYSIPVEPDDTVIVPHEIVEGELLVSVFGVSEGIKRSVVKPIIVNCVKSGFVTSTQTPIPPTPDLYDRLLNEIKKGNEIAQSVRDDANAGKFDGEDGFSPKITVKKDTDSEYILTVENKDGSYDTPNLKGKDGSGSGGSYIIGTGLKLDKDTNTLSVDTSDDVNDNNTLPITSAAVFATVGNIEVLLGTI